MAELPGSLSRSLSRSSQVGGVARSLDRTASHNKNSDMEEIFETINNEVIILKDQYGEVYWPYFGINGVNTHTLGEGYQIKMNSNTNEMNLNQPKIYQTKHEPHQSQLEHRTRFIIESNCIKDYRNQFKIKLCKIDSNKMKQNRTKLN